MCKEEARGVVGSKRGRCVGVASLIRHEQKQKGWIRHIRLRTKEDIQRKIRCENIGGTF